MKKILQLIIAIALCQSAYSQNWPHFISDSAYLAKVRQDFGEKMQLMGGRYAREINLLSNSYEVEALWFLYAYMPIADITDYPFQFHLDNVRASFRAKREMAWGNKVPETLFRHFVLPVRVNNEALDTARMVFYRELKERVRGMSMAEAILEVNHWCHEHVTYAPSDARTLSPLACMKNALGRCGEESTFTVAALRSIGIPARQVYTPRWAHTDDNHAWVEAWADGEWHFIGACEPEAVLDLGWFNAPASRAMLMHTRAFGNYNGPEEVMLRTNNFTEINLIDNYAESSRIDFQVLDTDGQPADNARVEFKIYNYAEFYTAVTKYADAAGRTFLSTGRGDMIVWASKGNRFGYVKASFGKDQRLTIRLKDAAEYFNGPALSEEIDIVPPRESARIPSVSKNLQDENRRRLAREDSLRHLYEATFISQEAAQKLAPRFAEILVKSRGNWQVLLDFIENNRQSEERVYSLLSSLSEKDLRDMPEEILLDNLLAESSQLCPRVEDEMITRPYKRALQKAFSADTIRMFRQNPALLAAWVKERIRLNPDTRALRIAQTPMGVWESRITDTRSRDIFFVSLARSLSIEARKDPITSKVQYRQNGQWVDVDFMGNPPLTPPQGRGTNPNSPQPTTTKTEGQRGIATLMLTAPIPPAGGTGGAGPEGAKYYSHFTISRINNGVMQLLNFDEGTTWASTFRDGVQLDAGDYILTTGTRLANGSVMATNTFFRLAADSTTTLPLRLRQSETEVSVVGTFDSESKFTLLTSTSPSEGQGGCSILSQTGRGYYVLGLLSVGDEPSDHALRDIAKAKAELSKIGRPLVLLFQSEEEATRFAQKDYGHMPAGTILGIDTDGSIRRQLDELFPAGKCQLPTFIIADTFNRVVFRQQGYTIGLGEQLCRTLEKL